MTSVPHRGVTILALVAVCSGSDAGAQRCRDMVIQHRADIPSFWSCLQMTMTAKPDIQGRPYLYVAQKEGGLRIYDLTRLDSPVLIRSIPISALNSLHVMSLGQSGDYLYLALGNHYLPVQSPGLAIVDVSSPAAAFVTDVWTSPDPDVGAGIVKVEGNYAYLGAMIHGLNILNVADPYEIAFVSQFVPDIGFPDPDPIPSHYNARGLEVRNGIVYLCYDAGGLRIIDTSDKLHPVELGRYSNPAMDGDARAYNNVVLDGALAYVAVDYCGLEVLDVSDPAAIALVGWWNPWDCANRPWNGSPGHANELEYDAACKMLFIATGKSDLHVVDVSDPSRPDSCNAYGGVDNQVATWGIGMFQDTLFLSYICSPWGIPYYSNWTGVKILTRSSCSAPSDATALRNPRPLLSAWPNPARGGTAIELQLRRSAAVQLEVHDLAGRRLRELLSAPLPAGRRVVRWDGRDERGRRVPSGVYWIRLTSPEGTVSRGVILLH